jgi:catechol 2,3-dioxygenase-like lactoylglutathione lyase family enzyme
MQLLDHVSISVRDIDRAKRFYRAILSTLGAVVAYEQDDAIGFGERNRPDDDGHTYRLSIIMRRPERHTGSRALCRPPLPGSGGRSAAQ